MTRLTIRIDFDAARQIGHGKIRLIEMIDQHGSISGAARAMDMSYRRAWLLLAEVNGMFSTPAVATRLGGKGGGTATLTPFGRGLVNLYRQIETATGKRFAQRVGELERNLAPASKS